MLQWWQKLRQGLGNKRNPAVGPSQRARSVNDISQKMSQPASTEPLITGKGHQQTPEACDQETRDVSRTVRSPQASEPPFVAQHGEPNKPASPDLTARTNVAERKHDKQRINYIQQRLAELHAEHQKLTIQREELLSRSASHLQKKAP